MRRNQEYPHVQPLNWPALFPRSKRHENSRFKTTFPNAVRKVRDSLRLFAKDSRSALANAVIASNLSKTWFGPA